MIEREELGQLTDEELNALVKTVREVKKERKNEAKVLDRAEREKIAEENLERLSEMEEGTEVSFIYKGEEISAPLVKTTDKRFIVDIDGNKRAIMPDKLTA
jgi:hypothetical protein